MMVTFVSMCEKKSLKKTRRVLDAFADRIGDNTWQTIITEDGLMAVKKMLRKTASKNTAVSCHWIRSRSRSQFLWVVGKKGKFNARGVVPVNTTQKDTLRNDIENDWKYLPLIKALAAISALLHDWGKASDCFQEKLRPQSKNKYKGDPIRHEWISTLLLSAFVGSNSDADWLSQLSKGEIGEEQLKMKARDQEKLPLANFPNAAKLIAWLIVSHHRLPTPSTNATDIGANWRGVESPTIDTLLNRVEKTWGYENRRDEESYQKRIAKCFEFSNGLLSQSKSWLKELTRWSERLNKCLPLLEASMADGSYRLVLHHARLCLMLGDHYFSSQKECTDKKEGLFANTNQSTGQYKQRLDEHLIGVAGSALKIAHLLPAFESAQNSASDLEALKTQRTGANKTKFSWQNTAVEKIERWKSNLGRESVGFFACNMAGTGFGKTFANAKIMQALSPDGNSLRFILALGLRTLTLQTGDEYRERVGLDDTQLGVLIGSKAITELHNSKAVGQNEESSEYSGSESQQSLIDEEVDYDCDIPEDNLTTVLTKEKDRKFLYAPVLACTIDHLMAATETTRGGRYILPCLRLMSSDLVIDEIDDFNGSDLIAIGRLIHLAGMLGRKVMISSATIPPSLAEGYFNAYKKGWQIYSKSRGKAESTIGCAWIDDDSTQVLSINSDESTEAIKHYQSAHSDFVAKRVTHLKKQPAKRKAQIIECKKSMEEVKGGSDPVKQESYFQHIQRALTNKHKKNHTIDDKTGITVSFGVVRIANISPCIGLTKYLLQATFPEDVSVKVMAYHSQQVMLLRHEQEVHLDKVLKRKEKPGENPVAFTDSVIRNHLDDSTSKNMIFIVVATPVEEVGRDHDFDWAVIEPSSYRSFIQLAGRVRRHREGLVDGFNIAIMQYCWRAYKDCDDADENGKKYFNRPGYEDRIRLNTHDINQLIDTDAIEKRLDAIPRIQMPSKLDMYNSLVDLEHVVIQAALCGYNRIGPESLEGYLSQTWWLTAMPQYLNPFRAGLPSTNLFLAYSEDNENLYFAEKDEKGFPVDREEILRISRVELTESEKVNTWLARDYQKSLGRKADSTGSSKEYLSLRYGELNFVEYDDDAEYEYNDQFGLVKR